MGKNEKRTYATVLMVLFYDCCYIYVHIRELIREKKKSKKITGTTFAVADLV